MDKWPEVLKGGLVRRTLALIVDLIVIQILLQFVAAAAFQLSDGALIDSNTVYTSCASTAERPVGVQVAPDFHPTAASLCTASIFGWPTARLYVLSQTNSQTHAITSVSYAVDRNNQRRDGFDLAGLQFLALVLMRGGLERHQWRSPGRRFLSLTVISRWADATVPAVRSAITRRYACFAAALLPGLLIGLITLAWQRAGAPLSPEGMVVLTFLGNLPATVAALAALDAIRRGQDAFYDQAAHTTVARLVDGGLQVAPERPRAARPLHPVVGGVAPWFVVP